MAITFCTFMLWLVLLKMRLAFMAFANRFAWWNGISVP